MSQPWPIQWIPYTKNNIPIGDPIDESPASTDIVGSTGLPAVFYQWDGDAVFFRMRLRSNPVSGGNLVNFNWGILISTNSTVTSYDWLATVNGQDGTLEIWENFRKQPPNSFADQAEGLNRGAPFVPNFSESIDFSDNVRVTPVDDGSNFGGVTNYFLDFQFNFNTFSSLLEINEGSHISFIYFTATSNRNANKDIVPDGRTPSESFGDFITLMPDPGMGGLDLIKEIVQGPSEVEVSTTNTWTVQLNISNPGEDIVENVEVTDKILLDTIDNIQIISNSGGNVNIDVDTITWEVGTLEPEEVKLLIFTVEGSFDSVIKEGGVLDEALAEGTEPNIGTINAGPSTGPAITILEDPPIPRLEVTKALITGPMNIGVNETSSWFVEIHVKNIGEDNLINVIVTDTILLDQIDIVAPVAVSKGITDFSHNVLTWEVGNLNIQEKATLGLVITGGFSTVGEQGLNSVFAMAMSEITGNRVISDHTPDIFINVEEERPQPHLNVLKRIIEGPTSTLVNTTNTWRVEIIVNNSGIPLEGVIVEDLILLDQIVDVEVVEITKGSFIQNTNIFAWEVGDLGTSETQKIVLDIEGLFEVPGPRILNRSMATGTEPITSDKIKSNISSPDLIDVFDELQSLLNIMKRVVEGPLTVIVGTENTWTAEIHLENLGNTAVTDIVLRDSFILDEITNIDILETTKGTIEIKDNHLKWFIDRLDPEEKVVLTVSLSGIIQSVGQRVVNAALAKGLIEDTDIEINSGPVGDLFIHIIEDETEAELDIDKEIIEGPLTVLENSISTWRVLISVSNPSSNKVSEIVNMDEILTDNLIDISDINISQGTIEIDNNRVIWSVGEVDPSQVATLELSIIGMFNTRGTRVLNRTFASGIDKDTGELIFSNIASPQEVNVIEIKPECIIVNKVYSSCKQRECLEYVVEIPEGSYEFLGVKYNNGEIVSNSLKITKIDNNDFKRVRFKVNIQYIIKLKNLLTGEIVTLEEQLPEIEKDIIMFVPKTRDEFRFEVSLETASQLLSVPLINGNTIKMVVGVFIIAKIVGEVQLLVPSFGYCPIPDECEHGIPEDLCIDFDFRPLPEFFPKQLEDFD